MNAPGIVRSCLSFQKHERIIHFLLTHWVRVALICVGNRTILGSDNCLSSGRRQAIICNNAITLSNGHVWRRNFTEILNEIHALLFQKMHLEMSSVKWRSFRLELNVFNWDNIFYWDFRSNQQGNQNRSVIISITLVHGYTTTFGLYQTEVTFL